MLDLFVFLTPLALLPIALLLRFVGCTTTATGTGTVFQLNMDTDLQKPFLADVRQVKRITVRWSIWNGGSLLRAVPTIPREIDPNDPPFLDPTLDQGAEYSVMPADLMTADHVSCSCDLVLGASMDGSTDTTMTVHSTPFGLDPTHTNYVFTLTPKPDATTGKRDFVLREYSL